MSKRPRRNFTLFLLMGILLAGITGFLVLFHLGTPPPMHSVTDAFANMDHSGLPALQHYRARDGAMLSYRLYPGAKNQVAVLVHGSAGSGLDMDQMAKSLQRDGVAVIVPDLRGHGANWPHGDIRYVGQLDDDMADLVSALRPSFPDKTWTLLGFSSGGGFVLRLAAEAQGKGFDTFVLLSPFLRYDAPTERPASADPSEKSDWYRVSVPRIVALSILNSFHFHAFDGAAVLAFPVPRNIEATTATYSFRMQQNFQPDDDFRQDIRRVSKPMRVFVGSADELFIPDQFATVFHAERADIPVTILDGITHSGMVTNPAAILAVTQAIAGEQKPSAPETAVPARLTKHHYK